MSHWATNNRGSSLAELRRVDDPTGTGRWPLGPCDHVVGRAPDCDVRIETLEVGVSRRHCGLRYAGRGFSVIDLGSRYGTWVNERRLEAGEERALVDGDVLLLCDGVRLRFHMSDQGGSVRFYEQFLALVREMNSLDITVVVERALALLRLVSGTERSYLVDAGAVPHLRSLLIPLDDPSLQVSRSTIKQALDTGAAVSRGFSPEDILTHSVQALGVRRIWACPILDARRKPVAAVYLDASVDAPSLDGARERLMEAVVEQIALALRNATLHGEVVAANADLEQRVLARTRELERSRAQLIGQDRLATLGRLVAAIAHELNNPAGAIASMAGTVSGLLEPVLETRERVATWFADADQRARVLELLDLIVRRARDVSPDTRSQRAIAERLARHLEGHGLERSEILASRLSRAGLDEATISPYLDLLQGHGEKLAELADRLHRFSRGLRVLEDCAGNVARIVEGLKTYSHLDRAQFEEADVHRGIQATLAVLGSQIPEGVLVETRFAAIPPFPHRPGELTQVWTNLVDNALRAMGSQGQLTIETRDLGDAVEVRVADTGHGIAEESLPRIFELEMTTRGSGAGLGLGLPICRTIVEQHHGGTIVVTSGPGETVFRVTLPKTLASRRDACPRDS